MPNPDTCYIVIGCGGSGAKTAKKLAELTAQDPRWRYEMDEAVHFFLVDTDKNDLQEYAQGIRDAVPGVHVRSFHSTDGFSSAEQLVNEFRPGLEGMSNQDRETAIRRLSEHLWAENPRGRTFEEAKFFRMPRVDSVQEGAGQVPMVSFVAAWQAMKSSSRSPSSLEGALAEFLQNIANVRAAKAAGTSSPIKQFNVLLVGSVAGGTGRGCATIVALKMKEMIAAKYGQQAWISGYFMNEDCFESVRKQEHVLPQMMNAMTGWSELSAWISLRDKGDKEIVFRLPGQISPHDPEYDVLRPGSMVAGGYEYASATRPIDSVGIIGRISRAGNSVTTEEDIYQMLAAGLYLRITQSSIESDLCNSSRRYFSIGTSVAEIPYYALSRYFKEEARFEVASRISKPMTPAEINATADRVIDLLGLGTAGLDEFFDPVDDGDANGTMRRLTQALKVTTETRLQDVRKQMKAQSIAKSTEALTKALDDADLADLSQEVGREYLRCLVEQLSRAGNVTSKAAGRGLIVDAISEVLLGSAALPAEGVLGATGSVKATEQVATAVRQRIDALLAPNGPLSSDRIAERISEHGKKARQWLEESKKRNGFLGVVGKHYEQTEIDDVCRAASFELRGLYARALLQALASESSTDVHQANGLFREVKVRLQAIVTVSGGIARTIADIADENVPSEESLRDQAGNLFADRDNLKASLANTTDTEAGYMLRRPIRPLRPVVGSLTLDWTKLAGVVRAMYEPDRDADSGGNARGDTVNLRAAFMQANFKREGQDVMKTLTLPRVLRELVLPWEVYLSNLHLTDQDKYKDVEQRFTKFFGVAPRAKGDTVRLRTDGSTEGLLDAAGEDFMLLGLATVAARTCRPFWRTKRDIGDAPVITVQVPVKLSEGDNDSRTNSWVNVIKGSANIASNTNVKLYSNRGSDEQQFNPYVLVVYTAASVSDINDVTSLDAWQRDPRLHRCLKNAESSFPLMPFRGDSEMWEGYRGSGFTTPLYLKPEVRKARWAPWLKGDDTDGNDGGQSKHRIVRALAYGVVGPEWYLRQPETQSAEGRSRLGPLFKVGEHEKVFLARSTKTFIEGYDKANPIAFPNTKPGAHFAKIPKQGVVIAENLDDLATQLLNVDEAPMSPELRALRDDLVAEWSSFLATVGYEAAFDPKDNPTPYLALMSSLGEYADSQRASYRKADAYWTTVMEAATDGVAAP